jgi:hypothetical protein
VTSQNMSTQKEHSLDNLLTEVRQLKERVKAILPSYMASLREISRLPEEFECGFWASGTEALVQKIKADYQKYLAQVHQANLVGKVMTLGLDIALRVGGMEPVPLPDSLRAGISMRPSGEIAPTLVDNQNRQPDTVLVTYEQFVVIAQRLKDELMKGTIVPTSEDEIPMLIYKLALTHLRVFSKSPPDTNGLA